ncbi:anaphase-promoting complex, subunit 5 [Scheffersomyces amazonensis]|uniref:anaphase-promoting complex, subunit 5 n=1 Tax=Scheffersomyces amazonensis TaxID=1078765 RepID=UPI00315D22B8
MASDNRDVQLLLTEDLSPHKFALLFLIQLYCHHQIPQSKVTAVLTVLINLIDNKPTEDDEEITILPSLQDVVDALGHVGKSNSTEKDKEDEDILRLQMSILKSLWDITSVKQVDNDLLSFNDILEPASTIYTPKEATETDKIKKISSRSLLGSFIYKVTSAFHLLKFDEIFLLYEALVEYREPSRQFYLDHGGIILETPISDSIDGDSDTNNTNTDSQLYDTLNQQLAEIMDTEVPNTCTASSKYFAIPKHDLQVLLERQIHLLETYGTPTPKMLKDIMILMTSPDSNTTSIQNANFNNSASYYYIRYLEHLHACNYNGAFESLHQYFDYMVSSNSKYFYHFALISKASLHEFFGEDEKAIDSIEEAISVAREHKDNSALTYILSWLFNFMKNKPDLWHKQSFFNNNDETQLLNFLIEKSKSVSLSLYSMSYNFETLQRMNSGSTMNNYLESIIKSLYISIHDKVSTFTRSSETMAMVWSRIGNIQLSNIYTEIAIESTNDKRTKIPILIRLNFLKFYKGETEIGFKNLCKLKQDINSKQDYSLYKSVHIRWIILLIQLNLLKGRFRISKELVEILGDSEIKDVELKHELYLLRIEVEINLGNYATALQLICDKLDSELVSSNIYLSIKLNLIKCKVFNYSENYSQSIILLIQQIQLSKKIGFITLMAEGFELFISTLNHLGYYEDSYELLHQVMPMIISIGNKLLVSQCYFELAKVYYHKNLISKVLQFLNLSILGFKDCCHLIKLKQAFEFELQVAQAQGDEQLLHHATESLAKLQARSVQENDYGYV